MNFRQQNHRSVADAILASIRKQRPQARAEHLEDIPLELLSQIRTEAAAAERKSYAASSLFARALQRGRSPMPFTAGLSALIRLAASLELDAENEGRNMETLSLGSENSHRPEYAWEAAGRFLCYNVRIVGEEVHVGASLLDSLSEPDFLLRVQDVEAGWNTVFHFVSALEKAEVKSLERPIEAIVPGDPEHSWVVG